MEFRLLGPVEAVADGEPVDLGRRRERGVLALLLLDVGQPVPVERLIELLFDEDNQSRGPRKAVQVDVSRLRRSLAAAASDEEVRLVRDQAGYAIHTNPEAVDVHRFTGLVDAARKAVDPAERARLLREALDLWRGPALADVGAGRAVEPIRARLEEMRLTALELRVEADLEQGRHSELVAELADLTAQHPTSERLVATHMRALYRSGRKRDALDVYQQVAQQLVDELGLDPGPELRDLHTAILRDEPYLAAPPTPTVTTQSPVRPAQLPADLAAFTGRDDELASLLARSRLPQETVVISAIDGMAGVGKTALAVHAAHRLSPDYPDGQLFIDLNGFTEGVDPVKPADALDRLLRAVGVPDGQMPTDTDDRAALYRSVLSDRRVLVLLDNAATEDQVEPLLPAAPGCLVLVTSRSRLTGLDQANPLSLDVLPLVDAAALFTRVVGASRTADEPPELVDEIVRLCGRLPLAVRLAAARLRTRAAWTMPDLLERLRDQHNRLAQLEVGPRGVAGAFGLSYRQLTNAQRRMFRLLGLHPGYDIDTYAAAALADCSVREADMLLGGLLDVHLLQQHQPGRYRFHDLLRTYAAECAAVEEAAADHDASLIRLLDHYASTAAVAMNRLYPDEVSRRPDVPGAASAAHVPADQKSAAAWLDTELDNLLAGATQAATGGAPDHTIKISQLLWRHLHTRGRFADAESLHTLALAAARERTDRFGEVRALIELGRTHHKQGRHEQVVDHAQLALDLARGIGHRIGQVDALNLLGRVHHLQGAFDRAADYYQQAHGLAGELDDHRAELTALTGLAHIHSLQGQLRSATTAFERGLALTQEAGDTIGEIDVLNGLARVQLDAGDYSAASVHLDRALRLAREIGSPAGELQTLNGLGQARLAQGQYGPAADCHQQVLDLARKIGDRNFEFEGLHGLGSTMCAAGDAGKSLSVQEEALALAEDLDQHFDRAAAHEGIGQALSDLGRADEAREHWQRALEIFTDLDVPDADRVRASLARLDQRAPT